MSVYILDHPDAENQLPDELEAFFHVLLFYAVRFLLHNCKDVAQFVEDYFHDYRVTVEGMFRCGRDKQTAMRSGVIDAGGGKLVFYRPAQSDDPMPVKPPIQGSSAHKSCESSPS